MIALAFADPQAYVQRYAEPDKRRSGLGEGVDAWPTPYWTVDSAMALNTLLLAAEDVGLGALFFAVFSGEAELRTALHIPDELQLLGALALGWPDQPRSQRGDGLSAPRGRRSADEIIHRGGW